MYNIFYISEMAGGRMRLQEIGNRIRSERRKKGLTQARLAEEAGLSRATLNGLEKGTVKELGYHKLDAILGILELELAPTRAKKGAGRSSALMKRMALRYIWWQPPEADGVDPWRVIAQVMDIGTLEDIQALADAVGRNSLIGVINQARPGWFRPRSWAFWHTALETAIAGRIPPVPSRKPDALPDPA
jgi:transcriptional regulator with XRE-family HTH domain